jgi:hypothetical protein
MGLKVNEGKAKYTIVKRNKEQTTIIMERRINNQLDADTLRFTDIIISTYFRHHYAHHQEYRSEPRDRL